MLIGIDKREQFYAPLRSTYWPELYGAEYSLYDVHLMNQAEVDQIRLTAQRVGHIFTKTATMLRSAPNQVLWDLDFPEETYPYIRMKTIAPESVIARLDLAKDKESGLYKVLEINADTPTFIKECFHVNNLVCKEFGVQDPNAGMEVQLAKAVNKAISDSFTCMGGRGIPHVVFTSHGDHIEDRLTSEYLMQLSGLVTATYCPLDQLEADGRGVYDTQGRRIDVLYRQTYPIEQLVLDVDETTGTRSGLLLLDHVIKRKVAVVNPPSAFLLQSKGVQVVIWGLHIEESDFFTEEEHEWIEQYFLPTYFEPNPFVEAEDGPWPYVQKPQFGREGDTIEIHDGDGSVIYEDTNKNYSDSAPVYQDFVELPKVVAQTVEGSREFHSLVGCFLVDGEASAIGLRVGNIITDNMSCFLPVGIK